MKKNQTTSDRLIRALEADNANALPFEEQQFHQLGQNLRALADADLPEANEVLREKIRMKLGQQELVSTATEDKLVKPVKSESRWAWRLALAGCLLLAIGVGTMMMPRGQENRDAVSWKTDQANSKSQAPIGYGETESRTQLLKLGDRRKQDVEAGEETGGGETADVTLQGESVANLAELNERDQRNTTQISGTSPDVAQFGAQFGQVDKQQSADSDSARRFEFDAKQKGDDDGLTDNVAVVETGGDGQAAQDSTVNSSGFAPAQQQAQAGSPKEDREALRQLGLRSEFPANLSLFVDETKSSADTVAKVSPPGSFGMVPDAAVTARVGGATPTPALVAPSASPGTEKLARLNFFESGYKGYSDGRGLGGVGGGGGGKFGIDAGRANEDDDAYYFRTERRYRHQKTFGRRSGEQYEPITENAFYKVAGGRALSTFSIDVDTASYSNMRRFLLSGQRPPRNAVRIEELVNYFAYDYPQPEGDRPFAVDMEIASCPWNEKNHLLRVALQGKDIHRSERAATNLVFLLDVSGSMQDQNKLPLLKQGLMMMVQQLTENDSVSIVTYAGNAGVVLEPTNGENKRQIEKAIEHLNAGGSTNGSAGIELAYELAQKQLIKGGSNRVILATDGDLNVGVTNDNALVELIKRKASEGVFLTVLGFGTGNLKDGKLEKLADNGNGMYAYIDNFREAHKVLIEQMSGSLETIAKDVKIQIEFNPAEVKSYRLIGYENRVLAAKDFDNDKKDAGEIGAGHSVTALYELTLSDNVEQTASVQNLKYQQTDSADVPEEKPASAAKGKKHDGELLTLALRYKKPDAQESERIEFTLKDEPTSFSSASSEFRFASAVASFGMILRGSQHQGETSFRWVEETASRAVGEDTGGYRAEFIDLVRRASGVR